MPLRIAIAAALFAAACGIYAQTAHFDFVNYDDPQLYENPHAHDGLSSAGVYWAFTSYHVANYIPVTLLTYLADYERAGLDPGAYHVTNFLFHAANTALLFLALHALTRRTWPSALVAAIFAVHPLHVESVAWISERKDVVSTFFGFLALWVYAIYTHAPRVWKYALVFALLALSLLAKPMLVTFPFLLLVLDFWPLDRANARRIGRLSWKRLALEKIPLFVLVAAISCVALLAQRDANALPPSDFLSGPQRLANAVVSYARYLAMAVFPSDLIPYYPHPNAALSPWQIAGAAAALAGISAFAWRARAQAPHLLAGWLWYLGTLVPVIGLVQVGGQALADRYTYIPLTGIYIAAAWSLAELVAQFPRARIAAVAACLSVLTLLAGLAYAQASHWRNSITLYEHTLAIDPKNPVALPNLGEAYLQAKRYEDAAATIDLALQVGPQTSGSHANLGLALRKLGRLEEAERHMREAVRLDPGSARQRNNLALVLMDLGRVDVAQRELVDALALDPDYTGALVNLGNMLMREGRFAEAESRYRAVLEREPRNTDALSNLGALHLLRKEYGQAEIRSREALEVSPDDAVTRTNLAVALMELGDRAGARREIETALQTDPAYAKAHALRAELDRRGTP